MNTLRWLRFAEHIFAPGWLRRALTITANSPEVLAWVFGIDVVACLLLYMLAEGEAPFAALYWAVTTGATVGYGDLTPDSVFGRVVAIFFMLSTVPLNWIAGAQVTASLIANPDCFLDSEQEQIKADIAETKAMVRQLLDTKEKLDA